MNLGNSKFLFLALFAVGLVLSLFSFYSYNKLKDRDDAKALYKVFYSEYGNIIPPTDSIERVYEAVFDKKRACEKEKLRPTITLSQEDSVKLQEAIIKAGQNANKDSIITSDFIELILNKAVDDKKNSEVAAKVDNWKKANTKKLDAKTASDKVRSSIIWLSVATLLSLLLVFIPRNRQVNEWFVVAAALAVSAFAVWLFS